MTAGVFDLVVLGSGSGLDVAAAAVREGWRVAVVEKGRLGGTCLNRGCIPSKMVLHAADVAETFRTAATFGIHSKGHTVDFGAVVRRVNAHVDAESDGIERALLAGSNPRLFKGEARFVGPRRLQVGEDVLEARHVLIATGARPRLLDIPGIRDVPVQTSTEALRFERQPRSLVIVGGGFIAAEMAHFFGALGTDVTLVVRRDVMLPEEDEDVARGYTEAARAKHRLLARHVPVSVARDGDGVRLRVRGPDGEADVRADALLLATGVVPNSDTLDLAKAGVEVDTAGYVKVDAFLRTTAEGVFALGDAVGRYLLKHNANHEASYAWQNMRAPDEAVEVDYWAMPHAVFGSPQAAGVGMTEAEVRAAGIPYLVGRAEMKDTGMGLALAEEHGFAKVLVSAEDRRLLGCHVLGPEAATLVHEAVVAMVAGDGSVDNLLRAVHVHPALSEVVQRAAAALRSPTRP